MYLSLLVPLDRSSFAEQALPLALGIARRAHARLDLVEVHALYAEEDRTAGWAPFEPERDAERKHPLSPSETPNASTRSSSTWTPPPPG